MHYTSRSANCGGTARLEAADSRSHLSGGRNNNARPISRASANRRSARFVRTRPQGKDWERVQDMFLASRPRFVALAYSILRNKEDAEDAVQDAVLSAYLHLHTFEGRSAFTTWFTRIVLNAALMIRRKRKPSRIDFLPESHSTDGTAWLERIPASQPDPEMVYAEAETFQLIDVLLAKMSPLLRQAFTMTYYDEMSTAEAGALLGITKGTFKSRLYRARQHLMDQAQRSLVAPIRTAAHNPFSFGKDNFQTLPARATEIWSPEMAFS